ncbi:hypothetical protein BDN72DRAFT_893960 [Pluteus cervinus]|uniref:Uncharacterized protein n=1 Tax=Pluteus cervinus TaxID=181527 RepID=A0ACD3B4R6_9AGAR|nr:hypothetical protein BDN72DRAFT_893960 [Pluteus cervinus]
MRAVGHALSATRGHLSASSVLVDSIENLMDAYYKGPDYGEAQNADGDGDLSPTFSLTEPSSTLGYVGDSSTLGENLAAPPATLSPNPPRKSQKLALRQPIHVTQHRGRHSAVAPVARGTSKRPITISSDSERLPERSEGRSALGISDQDIAHDEEGDGVDGSPEEEYEEGGVGHNDGTKTPCSDNSGEDDWLDEDEVNVNGGIDNRPAFGDVRSGDLAHMLECVDHLRWYAIIRGTWVGVTNNHDQFIKSTWRANHLAVTCTSESEAKRYFQAAEKKRLVRRIGRFEYMF